MAVLEEDSSEPPMAVALDQPEQQSASCLHCACKCFVVLLFEP